METLVVPSLKNSELRYRRLFETAQDGILILDAETGMIEDVNPYLIKMLGYSREEFIKKKLWEVGAFKDIEASKDAFEALQQNEYIRYEDLPLKGKDGRLIQVEFVSNVYLAGNVRVIQCNIREITEHKRIVAALQETGEKYRDLVNQSPDGNFIIELSGNIITVNDAMCTELGFSKKEFLSMTIWDVIPEEYLDAYRKRLTKILEGSSFEEAGEYAMRGKDGRIHFVEVLSTLHYSGNDIIGFQGIARDITARKRAEDALAESEVRFRRLVEYLPTVVYMNTVGNASSTLYISPQIETMLGYTPQEWLADPKLWSNTLHPQDRERILAEVAVANLSHEAFDLEYRMIARDGRIVWVHDQVIPVNDPEGQQHVWQGVMLDITERKQAETEMHQRLSELEVLYQSGLTLTQLMNPKAIAQKMIDLLDQKMDWHHTAVRLYDPQSETLELLVFNQPRLTRDVERSAVEQQLKRSVTGPNAGFSGWVIQHGSKVRSSDLKNDPRYFETFPGLQSGLYVPIKIAERIIGVISIESDLPQAFNDSDERLVITLAAQAAIAIENGQLFERLNRSNIDIELAYDATIEGWSRALDLRDKETEGHSQRVTDMTMRLARFMGMHENELVHIRRGALLHDIGKMGVPDGILLKPSALTEGEWVVMKKHPFLAYEMLFPIRYLRLALDIPYCHHEKWDGSGYPRGLKGDQIPLAARIFAVVDVWDALSSDRPYRPRWPGSKVREHIRSSSGTHFDPQVVDQFLQTIDQPEQESSSPEVSRKHRVSENVNPIHRKDCRHPAASG